jgi:hypothetical protein
MLHITMDDLFDILGMSLFASKGKWCTLNNATCIPLSSCEAFISEDECMYESGEDNEGEDDKP